MSPFKRPDSPYWYVSISVPGFGRIPQRSTETRDKTHAKQMEAMLRDLPRVGKAGLLRALIDGEVSLAELYASKLQGSLDELEARAEDPPLREAVEAYLPRVDDDRVQTGFAQLLNAAPDRVRLSWLRNPKHISDAYAAALSGKLTGRKLRPNSVKRSLHRAVQELLAYAYGKHERGRIMEDVTVPHDNDARCPSLTPEEAKDLLAACAPRFRALVAVAMSTGVDRGPLLRLEARHFDEARGELQVPDNKTTARPRRLAVPAAAVPFLRQIAVGRGPSERLFPFTKWQVRNRWEKARKAIGRGDLRFKDLRHVFATAYVQAGAPLKDLQNVLGHAGPEMSMRYTSHQTAGNRQRMDAAAERLGLRHLRAEKEAG